MKAEKVSSFDERLYWSVSQLATGFGPARETIRKRLGNAGVNPAKKRDGFDVYHIADAARAILIKEIDQFVGVDDPDKLQPKERLDWFRAENEKTKYLKEAATLIPEADFVSELASVIKICVRTIESMPDILEVKCQLAPDVINIVEAECDTALTQLAEKIAD